jgi:hypothetical protein
VGLILALLFPLTGWVENLHQDLPNGPPVNSKVLATLAADKGLSEAPEFTLFSNPGDPLLLRARTVAGEVLDYFGEKDDESLATAFDSVRMESADADVTTILLDNQARPVQILAPNGITLRINWLSDTLIQVTALTENGAYEVSAMVDLAAHNQGPPQMSKPEPSPGQGMSHSTSVVNVNVIQCDRRPVTNAVVEIRVVFAQGESLVLPGRQTSPGVYSVSIPTEPFDIGNRVQAVCESYASHLGVGCTALKALGPAIPIICPAIAAAIDVATIPSGEAAAILAACEAGVKALETYCRTLGAGPDVPGAPDIADFVCRNISDVVDRAARFVGEDVFLIPTATIPGVGQRTLDGQRVDVSGPFPDFTIEVCNEPLVVTIDSPNNGEQFDAGSFVSFRGRAINARGEEIPDRFLSWTSDRDGSIGIGRSFRKDNLSEGVHRITLRATDLAGSEGSVTVTITISRPIDPACGSEKNCVVVTRGRTSFRLINNTGGLVDVDFAFFRPQGGSGFQEFPLEALMDPGACEIYGLPLGTYLVDISRHPNGSKKRITLRDEESGPGFFVDSKPCLTATINAVCRPQCEIPGRLCCIGIGN